MTKSNIFKKIAAGVISLSMLIGAVPAIAEESAVVEAETPALLQEHEIELLTKLNIVTEAMLKLRPEEMSRGVFAEMLTSLMGVGGGDNAIEELYNLGIVHGYGNGKLKESQSITTYEAIKMLVCALGYATIAEAEGGYPLGYVKVAYDTDLITGSVENVNLTYEQGMKLILDAGNTNMATVSNDYYLSGIELGGDTMFYTYFDVMKVEGLMTANGFTSLDGNDCIAGEVIIGGNNMEVGESTPEDLIGYDVEAYCYDYDVIDELITIAPRVKYNKEVNILAGEYLNATGTLQSFYVEYEKPNGGFSKILVEDYYVLYNGKLYGGLTIDQLNASLADVTFIDNDRDNKYEIVKLNEYETYMVESINSTKFSVYAKYGKELVLDPDLQDVFIYKSSGKPGEFKDIASGAALSVLKSQDGELVRVYILSETASGAIEGMKVVNSHNVLTIGGKDYPISYEYENLVHEDKVQPVMSSAVKAYLDLKGNIVELELTSGVWLYGYIMRVGYDEGEEKLTTLSIYSQANKRLDLKLGDRVTVDGTSYKTAELEQLGIFTMVNGYPKAERQLVRYIENGGELKQLDTNKPAKRGVVEGDDALGRPDIVNIPTMPQAEYNSSTKFFLPYSGGIQDGNMLVGAGTGTICFTVPDDAYANETSYYGAGGMNFGNGSVYGGGGMHVEIFDINEANIAKVFVRHATSTNVPDTASPYLFLKELSTVVNKNGEAAKHVVGINLATGAEYSKDVVVSNPHDKDANILLETAQFGDVFRYRDVNVAGEGSVMYSADAYTKLSNTYSSIRTHSSGIDRNTYVAQYNEYLGRIGWADNTHMKLVGDDVDPITGEPTQAFSFLITGVKIYLVDCAEETLETIDATRVAAYTWDKVGDNCKTYVVQRSGGISFMIIYTNLDSRD